MPRKKLDITDEERRIRKNESCKRYYRNNKEKIIKKLKLYKRKIRKANPDLIKKDRENNKEYYSFWKKHYYIRNLSEITEKAKEYYSRESDKIKERSKKYYEENKDTINFNRREYPNLEYKPRGRELKRKWLNNNRNKARNARNRRKAAKLNATPKWLTKEQHLEILEFYTIARELQWLSDDLLEVDHIVPLQGKEVCGLNVPWNLQILTKTKNLAKGNRLIL